MGSSKYSIEQYSSDTSLIDVQLESVNIKKDSNVPPGAKAGLSIQIAINFSLVEFNDVDHLNIILITDYVGEVNNKDGSKTKLFTAKLKAKALFSINFKYNSDELIKDCLKSKDVQQLYIKQIYPVIISYARENLNNMGFAVIPIPFFLPNVLISQNKQK